MFLKSITESGFGSFRHIESAKLASYKTCGLAWLSGADHIKQAYVTGRGGRFDWASRNLLMDSGNKFNCVEWFVWWIPCYGGLFIQDFPGNVCQIFRIPNLFCCLLYLGCTSSATFVAWSCWVEVAKMKGPSLGSWVSMVSTWDEQLSAEQEGFCLKEPRKFS